MILIRDLISTKDISTLSNRHDDQTIFLEVQLLPFLTQPIVHPVRYIKITVTHNFNMLLLCLAVLFSQARTVFLISGISFIPVAGVYLLQVMLPCLKSLSTL